MRFDLTRAFSAVEGKAIPAHPAFLDGVPYTTYAPGEQSPRKGRLSQREAPRHMSAYGGSQAIDWLTDCIDLYADAVSTSAWHLEDDRGVRMVERRTPGTPPDYKIGPRALYDLLKSPNPFMDYSELMQLLVIDLLLVGNAYWFKYRPNEAGQPLAIYRLAPPDVKIVPSPYGPAGYEYTPEGAREPLAMELSDVIHFRRPNPHSPYYGLGVIQGGGRSFDLELAVTDTIASFYENHADPSVIIQSERRVPRDIRNKLQAQLVNRMSGSRRAGALILLEAGLKASTLSRTAREAMFEELARMSRDRVYSKFRASPALFGQIEAGGGSNRIGDIRREFDNYTIRPFTQRLGARISNGLTQAWGTNFKFDYMNQLAPEEAVKIGGEIATMPGVKVREVRRQYAQFGIEESTGDPEIDEMMLNVPGEELDEDGQPVEGDAAFPDRPLGSEPGRPPLGENTVAFPRGAQVAQSAKKALADIEAALAGSSRLPGEVRPDDTRAEAREAAINEVARLIETDLADAARILERGLLDHVEGKAFRPGDLLKRLKGSAAWQNFRDRLEKTLEDAGRRAVSSSVINSGIQPDEDLDYDAIIRSVIHRQGGVREIVETLRKRVVERVREQREAGADKVAMQSLVRETLAEWRENQVPTIALSEAVETYNEGTLSVLEAAGQSEVYVVDARESVADPLDTSTDQACQDADGSVWSIDRARSARKEHPNCRRAFLAMPIVD